MQAVHAKAIVALLCLDQRHASVYCPANNTGTWTLGGHRLLSSHSAYGVKGWSDSKGAHAVQVLEVVPQGGPERRINAVLDPVLVSNALDDRREGRVVRVRDPREQVVHSLVVQATADMCPEQ